MTRKERILSAVNHHQPDIIPFALKATDDVLFCLQKHFNVDTLFELLEILPVDMYGCFNNCRYGIYPEYIGGQAKILYPDCYPDNSWDTIYGYKRHWVAGANGRTDEVVRAPLANADSIADVEKYNWPDADWFDYRSLSQQCTNVCQYAKIFHVGGLGHVANLIGFERLLTDMMLNPAFITACFEKLTRFYVEFLERVLNAANGGIDIICLLDDFGTQQGPLISLELYRKFYKPYHKRIFDVAHRFNVKVMMHSCGAVYDFIPEFIEIGADILDPIQTNAVGMDPTTLVKEFGRELCFHGGIDTQNTMINGTADDIRRQIDSLVEAFSNNGAYIPAPSHYIQSDVPFENVLTMLDHVAGLRGSKLPGSI